MARPARPWFRFYVEAMRDPKMRRLTPEQRWLWVSVLSAARESCVPGHLLVAAGIPMDEDDLADYAGMKVGAVQLGLGKMLDLGMLDFAEDDETFVVPSFGDRQFESDDVAARTRKHRSQKQEGNVPKPLQGTPPETETEADVIPPTPTADAVGEPVDISAEKVPGNSRANGTAPRQIAARAAEELQALEHVASLKRAAAQMSNLDDVSFQAFAQSFKPDDREVILTEREHHATHPS